MVKQYDRGPTFDKFLENVNRLMADKNFREVLHEIDTEEGEAISLLAPDPAAFLRHRGVKIPEDYRISVEEQLADSTPSKPGKPGKQTVCYCLRICWWRWCITICICKIVTTGVTTAI